MQPVLRSFLAEISAGWLRRTKLKPYQVALDAIEPKPRGPAEEPRQRLRSRPQAACYRPPPPRSDDIASNM